MADISPDLAAFAAASNPQTASAAGMSPGLAALLQAAGGDPTGAGDVTDSGAGAGAGAGAAPSGLSGQGALAPGKPSARAPGLQVALNPPAAPGPPPTPGAVPPNAPPATPNIPQQPMGPPPTPNAPQPPPPPPQPPPTASQLVNPSQVIRGPVTDPRVAAAMNNGADPRDTRLVHAMPHEQLVPPEIMAHPEVRSALDIAFAAHGRNRAAHQVDSPQALANANPGTGLQQFGFDWTSILPMAAAAVGSMLVGPEIAPLIGATGLGASAVSAGTGAALQFAASEALNPKNTANNAAEAGLSGLGGFIGGALVPGTPAGSANPTAGAGVGNPLPGWAPGADGIYTNLATGATSDVPGVTMPSSAWAPGTGAGSGISTNLATGATSDVPGVTGAPSSGSGGLKGIMNFLMPNGPGNAFAQLGGGMVGSALADQLVPRKGDTNTPADTSNGPELTTSARLADRINRILTIPSNDYLQTYGASPATPPVRFFS